MHVLLFDCDGIVEPTCIDSLLKFLRIDSLLKFLQPKNHDLHTQKKIVNLKLTINTK